MGAVIDRKSFTKISGYLDDAKKNAKVIQGGGAKDDVGYFIEPTLIETSDPGYRLLCEEIFGPVVTAHAYPDSKWAETLRDGGSHVAVRIDGRDFRPGSRARSGRRRTRSETRPGTSTSTTSRRARSSVSSRSAVRAHRAPTTRPVRR